MAHRRTVQGEVGGNAGGISGQRAQGGVAQVPEKVHLLHAHERHPGCRPDDKDAAAGARAVGDQLPQRRVTRIRLQIVHAHGGRHQRHVVDHAAHQSDDGGDPFARADHRIQTLCQVGERAGRLQRADAHQNAQEEEDAALIDARQGAGRAQVDAFGLAGVQQVGEQPHKAEARQHTHVGRQPGERFESGHEQQRADAGYEHQTAARCQPRRGGWLTIGRAAFFHVRLQLGFGGQRRRQHRHRHQQRHQRRQEQVGDGGQGGYLAADPQHGGHRTKQPQQQARVAGADIVGDDSEAAMAVDDFHNGHGAQEEEEQRRHARQRLAQLSEHRSSVGGCGLGHCQRRPHGHRHQQRRAGLVKLQHVLQDDAGVPDAEQDPQ
eukprot:ctg_615.g325